MQVYTQQAFPKKWATTQNNLANAYGDRIKGDKAENIELAIQSYEVALQVRTQEAFPQDWAQTQHNLAVTYRSRIKGDKTENFEKTIQFSQAALLVLTQEAFPKENAQTLLNLGMSYQDEGQFNLAYNTYESAIATVELLRGEIISGEESKRKQAEEWNKLYLKMVEVCLQLGKEALALEYIERSKTRNLVELILERDSKIIFPPEVVTQLEQLRDEIATGQYKIQNSAAENTKALAQHLQGLKEQKKSLEDKYLPVGSGFNFKKFQSTLDKNTVIIEWCITNTSFETFIITSDNLQRFNSSTSTDDFWTLIDWMNSMNWVNKYLNAYYNNKAEWINNLTSYLNQLAENLNIEEILKLIPQNYSHLILIPHRFLHLLPLHSLPLLDGSFVCDKFPDGVSYAPSCQILQQAQKREHTDFQSLFAIQNPTQDLYQDYEKDLGAVSAIKKQFTDSYVLKQANAKKAEILHHDENTKLFKLNEKLAQANNIFFFCHGLFNPNYSLDSGLQLADENITLADIIAHFKLENCRLVTLAACETGVIDSKNVSDEYIGLPYGFLLAGSTNVVSSLWTVSATATALLMTKFYEELKTRNNIAVALNITQHWLRDTTAQGFQDWLKNSSLSLAWRRELDKYFASEYSATVKPFESPYYWSAFFVTGKGV
ncbi:MAG: CHAT domain-containing protein [Richelia sp. RM2_1_2]|nr:CHAT domain-containing protein [Richelia sp. RM2_1_2]